MFVHLRRRLIWKLFATYGLVILVGILIGALAIELVLPTVFERHMGGMEMMGRSEGMMAGGDLFTNFRATMNEVLLWGAGAASLVAMLLSWLLSRRLVAPIQEMMQASQNIADGDYQQRVAAPPDLQAADELGQLAFSFNRMLEQLQQTEEMRLQLIGDVSHELRTPLTAIKGSMEGLIDGVLPATPATFQTVQREADRLQRLVNDLQELSRAEAGAYPLELRPLAVVRLLAAVEQRFGAQFKDKGVELQIGQAPPALLVLADEDRTMQVLGNLVGNALQYTPPGGLVRVRAKASDQEIEFSVQDSGVGIAAENLPHVFRRFFRADKSRARSSGGSGIGLTIAKYFVEAQGGRIWAQSAGLGAGATFRFSLPLTKGETA